MNIDLIKNIENFDFSNPETKSIILGLIESMYKMIVDLKKENQDLKDIINKSKGEKGIPKFKPNNKNNSSMEKKKKIKRNKKARNIKIDREVIVPINKAILPNDAVFKGYEDKVIQNIKIVTDNVLFRREVFYSASEHKTYTAKLDEGLENTSFGSELKARIIQMYFELRVTENLICSFFNSIGISISEGEVSNIIILEKKELFTKEKESILITGIECSNGINIDDSGFKENGVNKYINIICNMLFSYFIVNSNKKGETVKDMFVNMKIRGKPLTCDDAPQWKKIIGILIQLCWVHEERHYKKLNPILKIHKEELELKISQIWCFYNSLKDYKKNPNDEFKELLLKQFDEIFNASSSYDALDNRLKLTYAKKEELLLVLNYPDIDIHNNISENGIRPAVIKRKISNGTRCENGTASWENHLSILSTCKKLNINYYDYILDVFKGIEHEVSLVDAIKQKSSILSTMTY